MVKALKSDIRPRVLVEYRLLDKAIKTKWLHFGRRNGLYDNEIVSFV